MADTIFDRTERLVGEEALKVFADTKVIVFGVGGVGSWCAEGLVRSGIGHLTIVDSDKVCLTNVNRQSMATVRTVGQVKVDALKERLLEINPDADINAVQGVFNSETADEFCLDEYDYVVDAIDSLKDKACLILKASASKAVFYSSMGAALKVDPTRVKVAEFWEVDGCPLGAAIRKKFRKARTFPEKKFLCVYGDEVLPNLGGSDEDCGAKAVINGSMVHITAMFGFTLSGLIVQDLYRKRR